MPFVSMMASRASAKGACVDRASVDRASADRAAVGSTVSVDRASAA
jgi:hypothetical protein